MDDKLPLQSSDFNLFFLCHQIKLATRLPFGDNIFSIQRDKKLYFILRDAFSIYNAKFCKEWLMYSPRYNITVLGSKKEVRK